MKHIYDNLLLHICNISIKAGHAIMQFYNNKNEVSFKKDYSPLTEADLAANTLIIQELNSLDKNINIITEESLVDWNTRKTWSLKFYDKYCCLVDWNNNRSSNEFF